MNEIIKRGRALADKIPLDGSYAGLLEELRTNLIERGWRTEDVIEEVQVSLKLRIDLVLCHNLYPLALVVIGSADRAEALPALLAEWDDIGLAYLVDGERVWEAAQGEAAHEIDGLPRLADVLARLSLQPVPGDPRFTSAASKRPRSLFQLTAIKRILDSIQRGEKRSHVVMPIGSGKNTITTTIIAKLLRSGYAEQALYVTELRSSFEGIHEALREAGIGSGELGKDNSQVLLTTIQMLSGKHKPKPGTFGVAILDVVSPSASQIEAIVALDPGYLLGIVQFVRYSSAVNGMGPLIYEATLRELFAESEREPPEGYQGAELREIASVGIGIIRSIARRSNANDITDGVYVVTGNDLQPDGTIDVAGLGVLPRAEVLDELGVTSLPEAALLRPSDIVVSSWVAADGSTKVARAPETLPGETVLTNRLFQLHSDNQEESGDLFTFLRSDVGQRQLRRYKDKTRISLSDLNQITVFLPIEPRKTEPTTAEQPVPEELGVIAEILRQIQGNILPGLKKIQAQAHEPDIQQEYIPIGEQFIRLAGLLLPRSLESIVLEEYPTPIAIAFRHYRESRFNTYEQVLRLRDLFESMSFFIYHVALADAATNLPHPTYTIANKERDAREAYDGFSTAHRMSFVKLILERATANHGKDLFMPELMESRIIDCIRTLQSDFRNVLSHTATPNDRQIRRIIGEYWPVAEELLESTRFLSNYRLLRIPSFYYKKNVRRATVEVYRGAVPTLGEEELDVNIDRDHLILVNNEQEYLDLYPLYQLLEITFTIEGVEKKRDETHLAVFKYRKKKDGKLQYESIYGGFELSDTTALSDFDVFVSPLKPGA